MHRVALIFAALCLCGSVQAGWYFVAPDGSDGASGRSTQAALATVQEALERARPGDTVVVQPGTYEQDFKSVRDGRPGAPIRVTGPADAVLTGGGEAYVIEIRHSHIEVSGITVNGHFGSGKKADDYRGKLVYIDGRGRDTGITGVRIRNMTLQNALGECLRLKNGAVDNEIADNVIYDCGIDYYRFGNGVKNGEAVYIGTSPTQLDKPGRDESTGNQVRDNLIRASGECVDVKEGAARTLIEHNVCIGAIDPESGGISVRSNDNIIRDNLVGSSTGAGIRLGGHASTDGTGNRVHGNQLQYNREGALKIMRVPQAVICGNEIRQPADFPKIRFGDAGTVPVHEDCPDDTGDEGP